MEDVSPKLQQDPPAGDTIDAASTTCTGITAAATAVTPVSFTTKSENCGRSSISIRSPEAQRLLSEGFDVMKTVADAKLVCFRSSEDIKAKGRTR